MLRGVVKGDPDRTQREWDIRYVASGGGGRRPIGRFYFGLNENVACLYRVHFFFFFGLSSGGGGGLSSSGSALMLASVYSHTDFIARGVDVLLTSD